MNSPCLVSWKRLGLFSPSPVRIPSLTVRCEYPGTPLEPTEVTFSLSPSYGLTTGHEANEWFLEMMREHEEFEVETDRVGDPGSVIP